MDESHRSHLPGASTPEVFPGNDDPIPARLEGHLAGALGWMEIFEGILPEAYDVGGRTIPSRDDLVRVYVVSGNKHGSFDDLRH